MLRVADPVIAPKQREYVLDCIDSNWLSWRGPYVEKFEEALATRLGVKHAFLVSNGTAALHIATQAIMSLLNIPAFIPVNLHVPNYTFIATLIGARHAEPNLKSNIIDIENKAWSMNTTLLPKNHQTNISIPVAISGYLWDYNQTAEYSDFVIGDMAQALGTVLPTGFWDKVDIATYSFFANKTITTGEGGAVVTNSDELAEQIKLFRSVPAFDEKDFPKYLNYQGFNFRPTNIQAAIGLAQLEILDDILYDKRVLCSQYRAAINFGSIQESLGSEKDFGIPADWMFRLTFPEHINPKDIMRELALAEIETKPLYTPLTQHPSLRRILIDTWDKNYPVSEALNGFYLPTHQGVTNQDIENISKIINQYA